MIGNFDFSNHTPAPRSLSADERALIEAAIAAGKVRVIPPHVRAERFVWCPRMNMLVTDRRGIE